MGTEDRRRWLARRLAAADGFVSGAVLAEELGVSRVAVWKQVRRLRAEGYAVDTSDDGYRLRIRPDGLLPEEVRFGLDTRAFGQSVEGHRITASTNSVARAAAEDGAPHGHLVLAEEQTQGRGRRGRTWVSPPGGLWFSLVLREGLAVAELPLLSGAVGVAVADALARLGVAARIRWPNDILVGERKCGGILLELAGEAEALTYAVVGIGLDVNVRPADAEPALAGSTTSLAEAVGRPVDRRRLLQELLVQLERWCGAVRTAPGAVLAAWRARDALAGRWVRVVQGDTAVEGEALGIGDEGGLRLKLPDGRVVSRWSGDVVLVETARPPSA
ncbi:MAG: biotin--[acetyl-CoA-carboxylase] ligase [Actinomycetia bacterium]|nr:biotin--[acetyl-CoA-carboxylase] ligase [Actinomycetes bacterium]